MPDPSQPVDKQQLKKFIHLASGLWPALCLKTWFLLSTSIRAQSAHLFSHYPTERTLTVACKCPRPARSLKEPNGVAFGQMYPVQHAAKRIEFQIAFQCPKMRYWRIPSARRIPLYICIILLTQYLNPKPLGRGWAHII